MPRSSQYLGYLGYVLRGVVILVYAGVITIGFCILSHRQVGPVHAQYHPVRHLYTGHRLRAGDFQVDPELPARDRWLLPRESDLVGKYLWRERTENDSIGPEDLLGAPVIHVSSGMFEYFFSLQNQMDVADNVNANSRVAVCASACPILDAKVISVVCSGAPTSKCSAVLELPKEDVVKISGHDKDDYRLVLR